MLKKRREFEIKNIDLQIENVKNREVKLMDQKISFYEENLKENKKQLLETRENIDKIRDKNPVLATLNLIQAKELTNLINQDTLSLLDIKNSKSILITNRVNELIEKKNLLSSMLLPYNYKNSQIVGSIITNDYPIKPKKKLIVVVAFVTGFILSIFIVFFLEFIKGIKEEDKQ